MENICSNLNMYLPIHKDAAYRVKLNNGLLKHYAYAICLEKNTHKGKRSGVAAMDGLYE
jgi:hypothetical protein